VSLAPRLTAEQERDLVIAAESGDTAACRRLVEAFLPEVVAVSRAFRGVTAVEQQDLVQEGVAGLLLAVQRFDPALGTPFWGYAVFWVRKAMQELVATVSGPLALSDRAARGLAAVRHAQREHLQARGTEASTDHLSVATGLSRAQVESLLAAARAPRSIEEAWQGSDGDGTRATDRFADPAAERAYEQVLDTIESRTVRGLADQLAERERSVIFAHYGLGQPPQTLGQIGSALGLTAERARQIEVAALRRLRASLARPAPVGE
jgi:RNA polymerase sigma factor (sigma-70 family)